MNTYFLPYSCVPGEDDYEPLVRYDEQPDGPKVDYVLINYETNHKQVFEDKEEAVDFAKRCDQKHHVEVEEVTQFDSYGISEDRETIFSSH